MPKPARRVQSGSRVERALSIIERTPEIDHSTFKSILLDLTQTGTAYHELRKAIINRGLVKVEIKYTLTPLAREILAKLDDVP